MRERLIIISCTAVSFVVFSYPSAVLMLLVSFIKIVLFVTRVTTASRGSPDEVNLTSYSVFLPVPYSEFFSEYTTILHSQA